MARRASFTCRSPTIGFVSCKVPASPNCLTTTCWSVHHRFPLPPHLSAHRALAHIGPDPVFMQISNLSDMDLYRRFDLNIRPIPITASDWINPDYYQPKPHADREIDLLMVAGWTRPKRHWLLFQALRKMRRTLRVVLVGQSGDGRTADDVFAEAKAFGVAYRIEIVRDAPIADVTKY
jgi:glycosyltransferase involved in cell wall biosynthesis